MRPNFYLMKATVSGALGGLLFGFDTAVIAGAIDAVTRLYGLDQLTKIMAFLDRIFGWTMPDTHQLMAIVSGIDVFSAVFGTVIGAMFAGVVGEKLGGRETLRITAIFYVISAIGCMLAWN